ncbi:sugar-transfer associated ATP-grasp domain-containing protein [Fundicoccus sp. Sow4_F4]|uniref:sugar-transfer associated ATP-grasp domain-containing protein n=1 Tax=Fundicoccus sp. Sow4_F4 TaxID=3438783 RepID=UPI003F8F6053
MQDSEGLLTYLTTHPNVKLVIKPIDGAEGRGVSVVYWADGQIHRNSQNMTPPMFLDYLDNLDDYFISEFIQQGEFAQALFPETLNTIRMLTMIDPFTQKAFIAASVFRVGTSLSMPTDNFRRRGLSLSIAFDTGQLGKAAVIPHQGVINWYEKHPDTGMQLTGQSVPHWPEIKTKMLSVANHVYEMKQIKYVGWDVVVTNSGICLLEGNSEPGVSLHQVHQPILANPKAKAFYHYHKVL